MKLCMGCMEEIEDGLSSCPHCGFVEGTIPEQANQMLPGSSVRDKYIVGKVIGYGGFGVTYIGYDTELRRKVAIKEYMPSEFSSRVQGTKQVTVYDGDRAEQFKQGLDRFFGEAKRLAQFQAVPGIVQIYDSFVENNTAYIVMEYLDGETLKDKLKREGKLSLEDALKIIKPIMISMKKIHEAGIIHRDIAPDNIMVCKDGSAKLIDFGASRFATATHSRSLTVLIKQGYAPVEQYNSRGDQGSWTDVYALAAVFYKMITGITPPDAMERKASDSMKAPSKTGAKVGKNVDIAIMNALNISAEYRTKTMDQFEQELLSDSDVTRIVEPDRKIDTGKLPKWAKGLIAVAAVLLVGFIGLLAWGKIPLGKAFTQRMILEDGTALAPNFVNQYYDTCEDIAKEFDVTIKISGKEYSDDIEPNLVSSQDVLSGSRVSKTDTIIGLIVSAGKRMVEMPDVKGLTSVEATALLASAELTYETEEIASFQTAGTVVNQSVEPGTLIAPGSKVTLKVSKGPDENLELDKEVEVIMPDLMGKSQSEAAEIIAGLQLFYDVNKEYNEAVKNTVIAQSHEAGSVLHPGDKITITVSLGNTVSVPDVTLKEKEEVERLLKNAGLKVKFSEEYHNTISKGLAISQSIESGKEVKIGSTVTVTISKGKEAVLDNASKTKEWSGWEDNLPSGVTSSNYDIEYRWKYRDKNDTVSDQPLSGRTLVSTEPVYSNWSDWSGWTDGAAGSNTDVVQYQEQTLFRYQTSSVERIESMNASESGYTQVGKKVDHYNYGNWSEWSKTAVSASNTLDVEGPKYEKEGGKYEFYCHVWQMNYAPTDGIYYTFSDIWVSNHGGLDCWKKEYAKFDDPGDVYTYGSSFSGYRHDPHWYHRGDQYLVDQVDVAYYRSRSKTAVYKYTHERTVWSDWSGWSTSNPGSASNMQVESKKQNRVQTRTLSYRYTYSDWGNWSDWVYSDPGNHGDVTMQVRYKEK